ncbi:MAG TPA: hypothetical protein VD767_05335, partial [Thermomicrobiales bacterium]|nr:hypothetical protein [Thermomicrobiales bacterium]
MASSPSVAGPGQASPGPAPSNIKIVSQRQRAWRSFRRNKSALVGLVMIITLVLIAIFAPLLAPH